MGGEQQIFERVQKDKDIVIDNAKAKQLEATGAILESDAYIERDKGETLAPTQFMQQAVDAETAARLAREKGIVLAPSVDASLANNPNIPQGNVNYGNRGTKLPSAIMESFKKTPPIAPSVDMTMPQISDDAIAKIQEYNKRLNKVSNVMPNIPKNANLQLNEEVKPQVKDTYTTQPNTYTPPQYYQPAPAQTGGVDYSVMAALIKESIREVLKEMDIKELVKEVLTEEQHKTKKYKVDENIEIKIGSAVFGGKVSRMEKPEKK